MTLQALMNLNLRYIVVSGNSGAGKSTLLRSLAAELRAVGQIVDLADEQEFHHPLLFNMFRDPGNWAYLIQCNFPLQRATRVMSTMLNSKPGTILLMERCLSEDVLFFEYYLHRGHIPARLEDGYRNFINSLMQITLRPHIVVHLLADVGASCARLEAAAQAGERQAELHGGALRDYISGMHELYQLWSNEARKSCDLYIELLVDQPAYSGNDVLRNVKEMLLARLRTWPNTYSGD
jgi:deoxyadenosine/deoxycytidine kinase